MQISPNAMGRPGTSASEDRRLVSCVLAKERKATAEFVARCADWLYPFMRHRLLPRADLIEDLMQEILFAAWQSLPKFRADASLRSWVMGIARHKLEDYYRNRIETVEIRYEDDEHPSGSASMPGMDQQLDSAAMQEKVQKTLAKLPEAYALSLIWRYRDEKSVHEMAQLTGRTEKAMERLLARARENFRRRWSDGGV